MSRAQGAGRITPRGRFWAAGGAALLATLTVVLGAAPAEAAAALQRPAATVLLQTTYHGNATRTGFTNTTVITPTNVGGLAPAWAIAAGNTISGQPAVVNGVVYWGDWNGDEHATTSAGTEVWTTFLGATTDPNCSPQTVGIASSPTVGTVNGVETVWTGDGDGSVSALNASTGQILWKTTVAPSRGGFVWSSPALYGGSIFIGVASFGDCPLVRGRVVKLDAATGAIEKRLYTTPSGCLGGGVWSSPAVDGAGALYVTTGNAACTTTLQNAILKINAATMTLEDSWQIPESQWVPDSDWGSTPTVFPATISGKVRKLVGSVDKNGIFYALDRTDLAAGPVWEYSVATGGGCPQCGAGSIAPAAFDGHTLYVAGGAVTIGSVACAGSVDALNPATGVARWRQCLLSGTVLGAVTAVPGLVFVTAGADLLALNSDTGTQLFLYPETTGQVFYGPVTVARGKAYAGNSDGSLRAFALPAS